MTTMPRIRAASPLVPFVGGVWSNLHVLGFTTLIYKAGSIPLFRPLLTFL
jgi:hypothetical protein